MTTPNNPWVVQNPGQEQVPVGFHIGPFEGVEEVKLETGELKWRWKWKVASGDHTGKFATAFTDQTIKPTTLPGVLIAGLLGRSLVPGENVKDAIDACKGKVYMVNVQPGPKGGKPQVRSVGKPPQM